MVTLEKLQLFYIIFVLDVCLHQVSTIPLFRALPTPSTTPYSHISSFLKQPRSDSRADKPDVFPGFDFEEGIMDSMSTRRPVTRAEIYTRVAGKIVGDVRERVTDAVNIFSQRNIVSDPMRYTEQKELNQSESRENDLTDTTTEFVGFSLPDDSPEIVFDIGGTETDDDDDDNSSLPKRNFLLGKFRNKTRALATLVFTPLLSVWTTANRNFNVPQTETDNEPNMNRNTGSSAFRNAFQKYSALVAKGTKNETDNNNNNNNNNELAEMSQTVRRFEKLQEEPNNDGLDDVEDIEQKEEGGGKAYFNEGFGIYILEIIGSVVGLTWGAINHVQNILAGRP